MISTTFPSIEASFGCSRVKQDLRYSKVVILLLLFCSACTIAVNGQNYQVEPFFNNTFPKSTPGANGTWEVQDFLPDCIIPSPLKIFDIPGSEEILVLGKMGEIWFVDPDTKEQSLVLDIKDRCLNLGEGGSVGVAIHPEFNLNTGHDEVFVFYRFSTEPEKYSNQGYNRLSKFTFDANQNLFPQESEEVLFQQYDRHIWHNGGALFFDNDGYLLVTVGDEGASGEVDITQSTQRIDNGFFSGVLRIDVDNDLTRSHPIRRHPISLSPPIFADTTFSQGYSIPNDNPWLNENGDVLEEFYAIGVRAPYSAFYDELLGDIWVADVGSNKVEELNKITIGSNYQWPYLEGDIASEEFEKPDPLIGEEKGPEYFYTRDLGSSIVGGGIYRGSLFPQLDEKFIFGDFTSNRIMFIEPENEDPPSVLVESVGSFGIELPDKAGIAGVNVLENGEVLISVISAADFFNPGKILRLSNREIVADPPTRLSELNVFKSMSTLEVDDAFIPYEVNVPLWSDGAAKKRWVAIPNDGTFDSADEQIKFKAQDEWEFPIGTVFIKHFELSLDISNPDKTTNIETRFFIIGEDRVGYGLTYKWNEEGTEAFLQQSRSIETFEVTDNGAPVDIQVWDYPSRSNCISCHNPQTGYVLGLNTQQINKDIEHPSTGFIVNQLSFFDELNILDQSIGNPIAYLKNYSLFDGEINLEDRILSYLDANCANCHKQNGSVTTTKLNLRRSHSQGAHLIANLPTESVASNQQLVVKPGDHAASELWIRDASRSTNQMPPIASNVVHQSYVDSLAKWIDSYTIDTLASLEIELGPNPTTDVIRLNIGEDWLPECNIQITDLKGLNRLQATLIQNITILDLSFLEAGMYFIEIKKGDEYFIEKVLVL